MEPFREVPSRRSSLDPWNQAATEALQVGENEKPHPAAHTCPRGSSIAAAGCGVVLRDSILRGPGRRRSERRRGREATLGKEDREIPGPESTGGFAVGLEEAGVGVAELKVGLSRGGVETGCRRAFRSLGSIGGVDLEKTTDAERTGPAGVVSGSGLLADLGHESSDAVAVLAPGEVCPGRDRGELDGLRAGEISFPGLAALAPPAGPMEPVRSIQSPEICL